LTGGASPLADGFGDAQDTFGLGPPLLDLALFDLRFDQQNLYFTLSFFTEIAPASDELPESLVGLLEFDVDQNAGTGTMPLQNLFSPPFVSLNTGNEFIVDFLSEQGNPGFVSLLDSNFSFLSWIPVTFDSMSVHGVVSLANLGNDDGRMDFTGIFGTFEQPTDAADKIGSSYPVPEPGPGLILFAVAALRFGQRWRADFSEH
jgi:hypothetical protein